MNYDAEFKEHESIIGYNAVSVKTTKDDDIFDISKLSDADKTKYKDLTKNLITTDINSISNYGMELQNSMTKYSNDFLSAVRTSQCGEMGNLINNLLSELDYIDIDELSNKSKFKAIIRKIPIINKLVSNINSIIKKYDTITNNVDKIAQKISATRLASLRDNTSLQTMLLNNIEYGKQIDALIVGGKIKLNEIQTQIAEMLAHPENYETYQIQDLQEFANNLDKKINDMLTLRYVIKQSLPQIRAVQYNNISIANKAQSLINTTIPIWRNQITIAVALQNQKNNIAAQKRVIDTTNLLLKKNAEMLKINSINAATENEKSVISIETLKTTTNELIETLKEVKRIHEEGSSKRREAEQQLMKLEQELEANLSTKYNS